MKICAIICEYNPLHWGHLYHIQKARELSGADAILCIQGGNFTQRGEPAIVNKYVRSKMALEANADIVVQIPTAYCCSSAEVFAMAGVKIANSFSNVTNIAFGVETDNFELLRQLSKYLAEEPAEYKQKLKEYLDKGNSLPVSRQKAIQDLIKDGYTEFKDVEATTTILEQPNNILAIEYLKALHKTKSKIEPIFTTRTKNNYNDADINGRDSSATAIRTRLLRKGTARSIKKLVPTTTYSLIKDEIQEYGLPDMQLFSDLCMYAVKTKTPKEIANIYDVSEGLENRFYEFAKHHKDVNELLLNVKTKRYSFSRLKRIVLRILLNIDRKTIESIYKIDKLPYIKVLAFRADKRELLKDLDADTTIVIRNNMLAKEKSPLFEELTYVEERANAVYNLLLKKSKEIPTYAPDIYTKCIQYVPKDN